MKITLLYYIKKFNITPEENKENLKRVIEVLESIADELAQ